MTSSRIPPNLSTVMAWAETHPAISLAIVAVTAYLLYKIWIYPTFLHPLRHLPTVKGGIPGIRHVAVSFVRPPSAKFTQWINENSDASILRVPVLFGQHAYMPVSAKALSELFMTNSYDFEKPEPGRRVLRPILGDGLVVTEGDPHRYQRKSVQPSFTYRNVKNLYPVMLDKAQQLCMALRDEVKKPDGAAIEMCHWSSRATLDIIGVAVLGRDFHAIQTKDDELTRYYETIIRTDFWITAWFISQILLPQWVLKLVRTKIDDEMQWATQGLRKICHALLGDMKSSAKSGKSEAPSIISYLMAENKFNDDGLVDQMLTFLAAGHETTSSALAWSLLALARRPDLQQSVREEITQSIDVHQPIDMIDGDSMSQTLEDLPLLNAVCNEVLRLWPTVPLTNRIASRATTLCGEIIPQGTEFDIPIWSINRARHLWGEDAEIFNPQRWIDPVTGKANKSGSGAGNYAFMTFLHGPRSCIGQGFARAELRVLLAVYVASFTFELARPDEEVIPSGPITVKPKNGLWLKMRSI